MFSTFPQTTSFDGFLLPLAITKNFAMCSIRRNLFKRFLHPSSNSFHNKTFHNNFVQPWLIVGLGNPGDKYKYTRHNIGFDMVDMFAESQGISLSSVHCKALFGEGKVGKTPVLLAKPQTYMNLSGECIGPLAAYYKLPLNQIVVIYDDMDLPCGVLRVQPKGGHAHHNGLKNVIYHFRGNREFGRLRIGIGKPPGQMDPKAFVLQNFTKTARERIDSALREGVDILKVLLDKGMMECVNSTNAEQKYKHLRSQNSVYDEI